jgi:hypothetical protein
LICCFFSFAGKISTHAFFDMRTCPHIGPKLACRRSGTKYCVDCFFLFQNTLEPPPSLMLFFLPLALRPNFSPWSLFLCQCSRLLFAITPPYLGEYRTSTSGTLSGALAALSLLCRRRRRRQQRTRRVQKPEDNTIHRTDDDDRAHHAKVRVWDSRSTFDHVHALDIISPPLQHRRCNTGALSRVLERGSWLICRRR